MRTFISIRSARSICCLIRRRGDDVVSLIALAYTQVPSLRIISRLLTGKTGLFASIPCLYPLIRRAGDNGIRYQSIEIAGIALQYLAPAQGIIEHRALPQFLPVILCHLHELLFQLHPDDIPPEQAGYHRGARPKHRVQNHIPWLGIGLNDAPEHGNVHLRWVSKVRCRQ